MKKIIFVLTLLASLFFAAPVLAYTVEKGDTMTKIAHEHGVSLYELAKANPQIKNLDLIQVGQTIHTNNIHHSANREMKHNLSTIKHIPIDEEEVFVSVAEDVIEKVSTSEDTQEEISVSEATNEVISISQADFDLLARIVRAEAQTEPFEGKVAVAAVVLNRVESSKFPNTIKEVIYQRGQFQPVSNGQINRPADQESIEAVHAALSDMRNIAREALFFYNPDIATSRWLDSRATTVVIGQHVFKN